MGGVLAVYELLPAFLFALAANVIVSLVTGEPEKKVVDTFDRVNKKR
jgi:sodium/proline symporter